MIRDELKRKRKWFQIKNEDIVYVLVFETWGIVYANSSLCNPTSLTRRLTRQEDRSLLPGFDNFCVLNCIISCTSVTNSELSIQIHSCIKLEFEFDEKYTGESAESYQTQVFWSKRRAWEQESRKKVFSLLLTQCVTVLLRLRTAECSKTLHVNGWAFPRRKKNAVSPVTYCS